MRGGPLRALFLFPDALFPFLWVFHVRIHSGSHDDSRLLSLRALPLFLLLFCRFFASCRGLPPHIKFHSPWGWGEWNFLCGSLLCGFCWLLLFLLRVCSSLSFRVCLLFVSPPVVDALGNSGSW